MSAVRSLLNMLLVIPAGVWLGGLVVMALAAWVIQKEMAGRKTEACHLVGRLRFLFQRLEGGLVAVLWLATLVQLVLMGVSKEWRETWTAAAAIRTALLVLSTLMAGLATLWLGPKLKRYEVLVGSFTDDKDAQTNVRKSAAFLHRWMDLLTAATALLVLTMLIATVLA